MAVITGIVDNRITWKLEIVNDYQKVLIGQIDDIKYTCLKCGRIYYEINTKRGDKSRVVIEVLPKRIKKPKYYTIEIGYDDGEYSSVDIPKCAVCGSGKLKGKIVGYIPEHTEYHHLRKTATGTVSISMPYQSEINDLAEIIKGDGIIEMEKYTKKWKGAAIITRMDKLENEINFVFCPLRPLICIN